jgi:hypothetical protein
MKNLFIAFLKFIRSIIYIFWKPFKSGLHPISKDQYMADLASNPERAKLALEKAWATRNFEIELYWKRATYFWAFLIPAFAGLFTLMGSANYKLIDPNDHIEVFLIICIGFIISVAWGLVNKGSKAWQRHWEIHVDLLEDAVIGPLYKTVYPVKTFSVSKINEIISWFFAFVWVVFAIKYFKDHDLTIFCWNCEFNRLVLLCTIGVILTCSSMFFGYGRGYFSNRQFTMNRRNVTYKTS